VSRAKASRRTSFHGSAAACASVHLKFCLARCRRVARGGPKFLRLQFLTALRQIQCEAFEIAERAMDQGTLVGSTQDDPGRLVCIESFLPACRT
jgi:hypothetical protein